LFSARYKVMFINLVRTFSQHSDFFWINSCPNLFIVFPSFSLHSASVHSQQNFVSLLLLSWDFRAVDKWLQSLKPSFAKHVLKPLSKHRQQKQNTWSIVP
jgi:hypothetical protein